MIAEDGQAPEPPAVGPINMLRLNRYTYLPILLDMLKERSLFVKSINWEDKNDAKVILHYRRRKNKNKLFALCFSYTAETIHHWNQYANGLNGCCIQINGDELINTIKDIDGIRYGKVAYYGINDLYLSDIQLEDLPFIKRWPYRCEEEYRIIWIGNSRKQFYEIPIDLNIITKITINQKLPKQIFKVYK